MAQKTSLFTAQEFSEKLRHGEVDTSVRLTGLAKLPEDSSTHLMFAIGSRCANWTTLPLDVIESVEMVEVVQCGDHTHPLVTLTFKTPETSEGSAFAALLNAAVKQRTVARARQVTHGLTSICVHGGRLGEGKGSGGDVTRLACTDCPEYEIGGDGTAQILSGCRVVGTPGDLAPVICYYSH